MESAESVAAHSLKIPVIVQLVLRYPGDISALKVWEMLLDTVA